MLFHNLVELLLRYFVAYLAHCGYYVLLGDVPRSIGIELVEYRLELIVTHDSLDVECSHQKFGVVYLLVSEEVNLCYYLVDLLVCQIDIGLLNGGPELPSIEHAGLVLIKILELLAKLLDLPLVGHLDKHVHGRPLQLARSLEALQSVDDMVVNLECSPVLHFVNILEPLVLQCLVRRDPLRGVHDQQRLYQIYHVGGALLEFLVSEMVIAR